MNDHQPSWEFTCKTCGGHRLNVYRVWTILAGPDTENWQEWGPFEADHHWRFEFKEKIVEEKDRDYEVKRGDFSEYAKDNSSSRPEDYDIYEPEDNPGNDRVLVNCASCDRKIEFGWESPTGVGAYFRWNALISFLRKSGQNLDIWIPGIKSTGSEEKIASYDFREV